MANRQSAAVEIIDEIRPLANHIKGSEKENPDALAGAIGADVQGTIIVRKDTSELPAYATAFIDAVVRLPADDRLLVLELALDHYRAGEPIPALINLMAEARDWAAWASRAELKAYVLASFEKLPARDQAAFLSHIGGRVAA